MVALAPFDWQAHDTYFVVAHLHYTLFGGMVFPVLAGVYYFYPFIAKKLLSERLGRIAFWLIFIGFNLTFLPMHFTGLRGMPRRVFTYQEGLGWDWLNLVSSVSAFIIATGFAVFTWDLLRPKSQQGRIPRNPWKAGTLEWAHEIPVETWGARSIPYITSRYPLWEQEKVVERMDAGRFYLGDAKEGKRETLITTVLDAKPIQCMRVSGPGWIPMLAAIFTGGAFIFPTFHMYPPTIVCMVLAIACIVYWLWTQTAPVPEKVTKDVGLGLKLPIYLSGPDSAGWWGVWITMLGDAAAFASLVFGFFFYWTAKPDFPPEGSAFPLAEWLAPGAVLLFLAWALMVLARAWNSSGRVRSARMVLIAAPWLAFAGAGAMLFSVYGAGLDPTAHVYPAIIWALSVWTGAHVLVGLIMQLYCLAGSLAGKLTPEYDADLRNVCLYWHFLCVTVLVTAAVIGLAPRLL